jgi:hypothetical protein
MAHELRTLLAELDERVGIDDHNREFWHAMHTVCEAEAAYQRKREVRRVASRRVALRWAARGCRGRARASAGEQERFADSCFIAAPLAGDGSPASQLAALTRRLAPRPPPRSCARPPRARASELGCVHV